MEAVLRRAENRCNDAILVVVDPRARHHAALAKGALLARKFQARVDLFACSSARPATLQGGTRRFADERMHVARTSEILQRLSRPLRDRGLDVTTQAVCAESQSAAVLEHLKRSTARFIVKDVHRDAVSGNSALTDDDWEFARGCPVSLLLSKSRLWPALPKICAVVDSRQALRPLASLERVIMEEGAALSSRLDGELDVLHACDDVLNRVVGQLATSIVVVAAQSRNPWLNRLPCDVLLVRTTLPLH